MTLPAGSLLSLARCACLLLACWAGVGLGQEVPGEWRRWDSDFDENKKSWKEIEAKIPPYPRPENLLPFDAGKVSGHRYFVDAQSLSLGEDGVMRYVLVIRTEGGATNVTFEGIRCDMRQQKLYAVGHANGSWSRARDPRWRRIGVQEVSQHGTLYADYFCANPYLPASPAKAIEQLRDGATRPGRSGAE